MSYASYDFMIVGLGAITALFILGAALAPIALGVYRHSQMEREVATRRVLGARRAHIVTMFLAESLSGIGLGILLGLFLVERWSTVVLVSVALLLCSAAVGSWLAARHASRTPFHKSGLFCE